jgi:hypothetical protein
MNIKDWAIAALLLAILGLLIFQGKQDIPTKANIKQARKDSARHAQELYVLNRHISRLKEDIKINELIHQKKIDSAKRLKMVQIDSVFVERYSVTLSDIDQKGARLLMVDLLEGQRAIESIKTYQRIVSSQGKAITHLKGIIKTDSVQILNLRIENKKYRRQSTLTKIGAGVGILTAVILLK